MQQDQPTNSAENMQQAQPANGADNMQQELTELSQRALNMDWSQIVQYLSAETPPQGSQELPISQVSGTSGVRRFKTDLRTAIQKHVSDAKKNCLIDFKAD